MEVKKKGGGAGGNTKRRSGNNYEGNIMSGRMSEGLFLPYRNLMKECNLQNTDSIKKHAFFRNTLYLPKS